MLPEVPCPVLLVLLLLLPVNTSQCLFAITSSPSFLLLIPPLAYVTSRCARSLRDTHTRSSGQRASGVALPIYDPISVYGHSHPISIYGLSNPISAISACSVYIVSVVSVATPRAATF